LMISRRSIGRSTSKICSDRRSIGHPERLIGMLVSGFGVLYVLSGRLNAEGFVFATLIDRPFVAPTMATLWYFGALPAPLALLFGIEDSASWLWTLLTWRAEWRAHTCRA